ncbi:MAG: alpha/beta fold hydrolase [Pseudomonadales bacterium]|nr:alpha/beta fold hydrolase [Pseudomonadales bacterium]
MLGLNYRQFKCDNPAALHVVLIHGWGLHSGVFNKIIEPLRAFAHVTLIDRAGYAPSPMMTAAQETQAILNIAPPCAIYIGWSLGGMLVLDLASRYPHRVMAVMVVATNPCFVQRDDWLCAMPLATFKAFEQSVVDNMYVGLLRFIGLQCQGSATQRHDIRYLQEQLMARAMPNYHALLAGLSDLLQLDIRQTVQVLRCPMIWLRGAKDSLAKADIDALFALNPLIAVSTTSEAAHVPFVSHPTLFVNTVKRFIDELQHDQF